MRKLRNAVMCMLVLMMTACIQTTNTTDDQITQYENYYNLVLNNTAYISASKYYDLSVEMADIGGGAFRYYVFVDNPRIAMMKCKVMVVENDLPVSDDKVMPSVGITETPYALIPNQVNNEGGYAKGLIASGETDSDTVNLKILVEWTSRSTGSVYREYFSCTATTETTEFYSGSSQEQ